MQLGFVSAILPELTLEELLAFASDEGFGCIELMCWPRGKADRRYAGVTHLDVTDFTSDAADHLLDLVRIHGVKISALGYYPNPLDPHLEHRQVVVEHLKKIIRSAPAIGVHIVNTFIGRDPSLTVAANLKIVQEVWPEILAEAVSSGVKIGIEHCPMLFGDDEWPGGKNVAISPAVWRKLFEMFPGSPLGLNFDPSHLVWQFIDCPRAVREFGKQIVHVHAKDERIDQNKLYEVGVLGSGWYVPKLPGLGDVKWSEFFSALSETGYNGAVCIEVEDRAYEGSLQDRKRALRQSRNYLEQFFG